MLLPYETVFSRTLGRINDPKELSLDQSDFTEIYTERLHNVVGNPRIRRLFSSLVLDDEIQEVNFTLNYSVDDDSDTDFVSDILVLGMTIEWLQPQVDTLTNVIQMLGTTEEKMLNNPYKNARSRLDEMKTELNKMIRDYGYMYNSYITES